ncbi:hypothetical protein evm_002449 [Chilo suppressalis]|nr:hypothetical protein evm_002449 [Chilo suppressalis]
MKKSFSSKQSPKNIAQNRLTKSKIMKVANSDLNLDCRENVQPPVPFVSKFNLKIHDRVTEDFGRTNPFDIPDRLRVFTKSKGLRKEKVVPFIMSEPHTICDVDNSFYKIIEGRPLRQFNDIKVYMRTIRDITLFRANAAYLKDQIIQVDTFLTTELHIHNKIDALFISCKDNFVQFAKESYNDAKTIQELAKEKEMELDQVRNKLEALCFEYVALRNKVGSVMVNFEILSRYRIFLNSLSPEAWINENKQKRISICFDFDEISSSEELFNEFKRKLKILQEIPLKLYFKRPKTLISVFDNICHLCLTYMGVNVFMSNIIKSVVKGRNILKTQLKEEENEMKDLIEIYKGCIKFEEEKEQVTKIKFENILISDFQSLYASYEASKLFTCLQYTNTQLFHGAEDPKDTVAALMLQLETNYFELTAALDSLKQDVVKQATSEFFSEDVKMIKRAHDAKRSLKECDILRKALFASFEPPRLTQKVNR